LKRVFLRKLVFIYLGFLTLLKADIFHYQNIYQGDSATIFGGAYTALSDDFAGTYNNPAGFSENNASASATIKAYSTYSLKYKHANTLTGDDYSKNSRGSHPAFFGISPDIDLFGGRVGFVYFDSDSIDINQNDYTKVPDGNSHSSIELKESYSVSNYGISYGRDISKKWSFGISLFGVEKRSKYVAKQFVDWRFDSTNLGEDSGFRVVNYTDSLFYEDRQYGVKPIVGVIYKNRDERFGLSIGQEFILERDYKSILTYFSEDYSVYQTQTSNELPETPININFGYALVKGRSIFSLDLKYYSAVNRRTKGERQTIINDFSGGGESGYTNEGSMEYLQTVDFISKEVVNVSIGYQYTISNDFKIGYSFFTDYSKIDQDTFDEDNQYLNSEKVDLVGQTLSLSFGDIDFGILYSFGTGEAKKGIMNLISKDEKGNLAVEQQQVILFLQTRI
jgi:hypothetical protein